MQSDTNLDETFTGSTSWNREDVSGRKSTQIERFKLPTAERGKLSFSGNERNHLFKNVEGGRFEDVSGISGLDTPQDGRTFGVLDFDRDGWQDIALLNINSPVLSLFRNQLGAHEKNDGHARFVVFKLIGGNHTSVESSEHSNRDAIGARITIDIDGNNSMVQQVRRGEGLAAQNSAKIFFGIGKANNVKEVEVRWPSGKTTRLKNIKAGQLVTIHEDVTQTKDGSGIVEAEYRIVGLFKDRELPDLNLEFLPPQNPESELTIYTSVATWCPNCRKQLPQLKLLRNEYTRQQLGMIAIPIDPKDSADKLKDYVDKYQPPYELAGKWAVVERENFGDLVKASLDSDVLPATVISNKKGKVIFVGAGVPSISDIERLIADGN